MIVVTGAAGFIGSNLARALLTRGHRELLLVDRLAANGAFRYLPAEPVETVDLEVFRERLERRDPTLPTIDAVFHQGACTDTLERDWDYLDNVNLGYSKVVARFCQERGIPLVYASSAAVYGMKTGFREEPECEGPINEYARSKLLFDQWLRDEVLSAPAAPIVGLRYFNVYGPREGHKGNMASVAFKMHGQLRDEGVVRLFEGSHGFADGEQERDFVFVDDVVDVNLWFFERRHSGIFNCGTGSAEPFNAIARAVLEHAGHGRLEYVPFPPELEDRYQASTQADLTRLRETGYDGALRGVADGVRAYMEWLDREERE